MMKRLRAILTGLTLAASLFGCGGNDTKKEIDPLLEQYPSPKNVQASDAGIGAVLLTWDAVDDASEYAVFYGQNSDLAGSGAEQGTSGELITADTFFKIKGLPLKQSSVDTKTCPTPYFFAVIAMGEKGTASNRSEVARTTVQGTSKVLSGCTDPIAIDPPPPDD